MPDTSLTLLEWCEHRLARGLNRLPLHLQVLLSGRPPVRRDGLTLHPELQLLLAVRERMGVHPITSVSLDQARNRLRRDARVHAGEPVAVGAVRELVLETRTGPLKARHYAPEASAERRPLLVFFHGGGFVLGDLDTHDPACRLLCRHANVHVLAVEYRLAPEAPFPAPLEDSAAAFAWACDHAEALGADPQRIAVGGDSAGGNLSAAVSQLAVREGGRAPALQLLLYPALDRTVTRASFEQFAEGFVLTRADVEWFQQQYTRGGDCSDPRISPRKCRELAGLPPALVITAGFDPLRDEGEAYAEALQRAGTPAALRRYDGLVHGFINFVGVSRACREAVVEIAGMVRERLARAPGQGVRNEVRE